LKAGLVVLCDRPWRECLILIEQATATFAQITETARLNASNAEQAHYEGRSTAQAASAAADSAGSHAEGARPGLEGTRGCGIGHAVARRRPPR